MSKIKVVFVKARGEYKLGTKADIEPGDFAPLADNGYVVTASEYDRITAADQRNRNVITAAVKKMKDTGALPPKDDATLTAALAQYEQGGSNAVTADLIAESLTVKASEAAKANELEQRRTSGGSGIVLGGSLRDDITDGYIKAREGMHDIITKQKDGLKAAIKISRESCAVLASRVLPIYAKGDNVVLKDMVRAADNVDGGVGTLDTGLVLMRNLGFLKNKLTFLDKISTDLRNEPVLFGQNVLTRYITPPGVLTYVPGVGLTSDATTIANWKATVTATNPAGTAVSGTLTLSQASATDVNVVLNNYQGVEIGFNNYTLSGTLRNLFAEQQGAMMYSLAETINKALLTTLFSATWAAQVQSTLSVNGGSSNLNTFGLPNVITIKNIFTLNKIPDVGRFALLYSSYHDAILTDPSLLSAKAILALIKKDESAFEDGELPQLFGVNVLESQLAAAQKNGTLVNITNPTAIPQQVGPGGFIGFAGNAAAALFVARIPQDYTKVMGEIPATAALEVVTEPDSGLSMLVTKRIDHVLQNTYLRAGLMYNFAQGDPRQGFTLNP